MGFLYVDVASLVYPTEACSTGDLLYNIFAILSLQITIYRPGVGVSMIDITEVCISSVEMLLVLEHHILARVWEKDVFIDCRTMKLLIHIALHSAEQLKDTLGSNKAC